MLAVILYYNSVVSRVVVLVAQVGLRSLHLPKENWERNRKFSRAYSVRPQQATADWFRLEGKQKENWQRKRSGSFFYERFLREKDMESWNSFRTLLLFVRNTDGCYCSKHRLALWNEVRVLEWLRRLWTWICRTIKMDVLSILYLVSIFLDFLYLRI